MKGSLKYITEFRDVELVNNLVNSIKEKVNVPFRVMEICGGHTHAIHRFGIESLLPSEIQLISGPGCPVCVTPATWIDSIVQAAKDNELIVTSYGDLIRVPGIIASFEDARRNGLDVRVVYSILDALELAKQNPDKRFLFPSIGFETTTPACAAALQQAEADGVKNFFVSSSHKVIKPAMEALLDGGADIDAFLCPGHVSTITGSQLYQTFPDKYDVSCVISGFEPVDILLAILKMVEQQNSGKAAVDNAYSRAVSFMGNTKAQELVNDVFDTASALWRGIGEIPDSGLKINKRYSNFDADSIFGIEMNKYAEPAGCKCPEVLIGKISPPECQMFGQSCTPDSPVGACMVSPEGACNAWYKYRKL